jgi:hypothetical protein
MMKEISPTSMASSAQPIPVTPKSLVCFLVKGRVSNRAVREVFAMRSLR